MQGKGNRGDASKSGTPPKIKRDRFRSLDRKKRQFIAALQKGGTVYHATQASRIGRRTVYTWRRDDAEFAAEWDDAVETVVDQLEQSAIGRAIHGVEEPVFYQGAQVGTRRIYDTALTIFLLKMHRPGHYNRAPGDLGDGKTPDADLADRIAGLIRAANATIPRRADLDDAAERP